jgi:hypothetical protein
MAGMARLTTGQEIVGGNMSELDEILKGGCKDYQKVKVTTPNWKVEVQTVEKTDGSKIQTQRIQPKKENR